jgi:hypothetical protein
VKETWRVEVGWEGARAHAGRSGDGEVACSLGRVLATRGLMLCHVDESAVGNFFRVAMSRISGMILGVDLPAREEIVRWVSVQHREPWVMRIEELYY